MVRDPYWTHAYWEITPQKVEEIKDNAGKKVWKGIQNFSSRFSSPPFRAEYPADIFYENYMAMDNVIKNFYS